MTPLPEVFHVRWTGHTQSTIPYYRILNESVRDALGGCDEVHRVIFEELVLGRIEADSRTSYRRIVAGLIANGAQAIIFGCTEIGLLIDQSDSAVPVFDTTTIHAQAAARWALGEPPQTR